MEMDSRLRNVDVVPGRRVTLFGMVSDLLRSGMLHQKVSQHLAGLDTCQFLF